MPGLLPAAIAITWAGAAASDGAIWLECRPALPNYCANIHIGCAGRSNVPTEPFKLSFEDKGVLHRADDPPQSLGIVWSNRDAVFRSEGSRDWIRVQFGTKDEHLFSERIYRGAKALMTHGVCEATPKDFAIPSRQD